MTVCHVEESFQVEQWKTNRCLLLGPRQYRKLRCMYVHTLYMETGERGREYTREYGKATQVPLLASVPT